MTASSQYGTDQLACSIVVTEDTPSLPTPTRPPVVYSQIDAAIVPLPSDALPTSSDPSTEPAPSSSDTITVPASVSTQPTGSGVASSSSIVATESPSPQLSATGPGRLGLLAGTGGGIVLLGGLLVGWSRRARRAS